MYLKRHFVTTFNPEQIQEKLTKRTDTTIDKNTLSFYQKAKWLISTNEQGFVLTTPSKWYNKPPLFKIKGDVSPLPFNGGSKVELTLSCQCPLFVFGIMAMGFVGFYLRGFSSPLLLILMFVVLFLVMSFLMIYWLSEKLKDEFNGS